MARILQTLLCPWGNRLIFGKDASHVPMRGFQRTFSVCTHRITAEDPCASLAGERRELQCRRIRKLWTIVEKQDCEESSAINEPIEGPDAAGELICELLINCVERVSLTKHRKHQFIDAFHVLTDETIAASILTPASGVSLLRVQ